MKLFVAGISHRTAPLELRERLALTPSQQSAAAIRLKLTTGATEVVWLSTCNRVEVYAASESEPPDAASLFEALTLSPGSWSEHIYHHSDAAALTHLFSVAGGLDSMVLGETEITGQVKAAYERAHAEGLTGRTLNQSFQKALATAKAIRTRTAVGRGATSIGGAAVQLAERVFGRTLAGKTILIIGAGQMGDVCVRHLAKRGVKELWISNRSPERAEQLATECGGRPVPWAEVAPAVARADVVIAATGCPTWLLRRAEVDRWMESRHRRPLVLVDLGVPRNIEPEISRLEAVFLHNVDDLELIVRHNRLHRENELAACRKIIADAVAALWPRLARQPGTFRGASGGTENRMPAWLLPDASVAVPG